ncbi:ABC transporter ATP-binding protein [Spiroplasma endosymbiont of Othius punctulatus]|uniref:ABC transporter ATP-binding protein n=1 Tax=Spiroplasma endosymbiont of Othius punctulatus TaxID=3066289 RepID=UPI0030CDE173
MNKNIIEISNITKNYGNYDINLLIEKNKIIGIIGANGAGKSTLIKQIMGFITPDVGSIKIDGLDSKKDHSEVMQNVGYISGDDKLFSGKTAKSYFRFIRTFKNNIENEYLSYLINYFSLDVNKKISKMSKGNKQKVSIIAALMTKPKILILDEPTNGLDPLIQNKFNKIIIELKNEGSSIIMCSHNISDVKDFCEKLIVIKEGKIFYYEDMEYVKNKYQNLNDLIENIYENRENY